MKNFEKFGIFTKMSYFSSKSGVLGMNRLFFGKIRHFWKLHNVGLIPFPVPVLGRFRRLKPVKGIFKAGFDTGPNWNGLPD